MAIIHCYFPNLIKIITFNRLIHERTIPHGIPHNGIIAETVGHNYEVEINKMIPPELKKALSRFSTVFERLKKEYPDEMDMMFKDHDQLFAVHGWYIYDGSSIEEVLMILKLFNQHKADEAEEKIINIFENNIQDIESDLVRFNGDSSHIISEAIQCHNKELYYASTILFLSITDGLADGKLFKRSFFQKIRKRNPKHFLLDIFNEKNPVNKSYTPNKSSNTELMRNGIMHGNSLNYGNKINSLKALSLLHFISIRKHKLKK